MFDLESAIKAIGLFGVILVVFAETGLLIGFLLPGDSLLFTAGFLASQGVFDIHALSHGCFAAAVIGNMTSYAFGQRVGRKLFERPNSRFFKHEHLVRAHNFYEKYGPIALVLARFIPVVRVFAPIVAVKRPFAAVAVVNDAMVARAHDRVEQADDPTAHAVVVALREAARRLGRTRLADATIFSPRPRTHAYRVSMFREREQRT